MSDVINFELEIKGTDMKPMESGRLLWFMFVHTIRGSARYYLSMVDADWSYFDDVYEDDAEVVLRWGATSAEEEVWSPRYTMLPGHCEAAFSADFVHMMISGMDKGSAMVDTCSEKIFKDKKISEMVQELAQESGLDTRVETTDGKFHLCQGTLSDGEFIRKVLLPRAYSGDKHDFLFYIGGEKQEQGKTVVFEPPDLNDVQATFQYPGISEGFAGVEKIRLHYRPVSMGTNAALSTQVRAVDPLEKEAKFFTADDDTVSYKTLASKKPGAPDKPATIVTTAAPFSEEFEQDVVDEMAKALWSQKMRELWIVEAETAFSPKLEVGKVVELNMTQRGGKTHFASGKYLLGALMTYFNLEDGKAFTKVFLSRRSR